nr:hypothetical protein [Akkermansiaceae bacterium]
MNTRAFRMVHTLAAAAWLAAPPAWLDARTAEDSFHFRNMSSEPPGEAVRQDLHPQLAVAGNLVHLAWLSQLPEQAGERLMYRRSTDGGASFGPTQILFSVGQGDFLSNGLMTQD